MNSTLTRLLAALALSTGLMAAAHADSEQFVFVQPVGSTNTYTGTFSSTISSIGSFTDTFDFSGAPPFTDFSFAALAADAGISFTSVTLTFWGGDGTALPLDSSTVTPSSINAAVANQIGGAYQLIITGVANVAGASYGGGIGENTAAPVPEPQNWALMLAGLGLTAGALRRRRSSN